RDIVLTKIHILSQRDQFISSALVAQELKKDYQLSIERTASAIWYLSDFRYILRDQENRDHIRLTPRGMSLIEEGGFVQQRLNNRSDLREKIDELSQTVSQLEERIAALEGPSEPQQQPAPAIPAQKRPLIQRAALIAALLIASVLFAWAMYSLLAPSS
ncbi:MAG: hypothetical protein AAFY48_09300, partial [Bacteroidota bacterium]